VVECFLGHDFHGPRKEIVSKIYGGFQLIHAYNPVLKWYFTTSFARDGLKMSISYGSSKPETSINDESKPLGQQQLGVPSSFLQVEWNNCIF
jgi:hypothetical protein